jgi:hypothetical protein
VDTVVEGSVQRAGDRVRIIALLIDARADQHLWVRSYERDLRDVLALQDEVAQAIANELKIEIASNGKPRPRAPGRLTPMLTRPISKDITTPPKGGERPEEKYRVLPRGDQ